MKSLKQFSITAVIFLVLYYPFFIVFSPVKIEIIPKGTEIQARIYKRAMFNPFNNKFIPNVKQAVITETKEGQCRLELEDIQGHRFPITSYDDPGFESETKLQNQINNSIKNKTHFKHNVTSSYLITLILILAIILLPLPKLMFYILRYGDAIEDNEEY